MEKVKKKFVLNVELKCDVSDCGNKRTARTYCAKHYKRWQVHGDSNTVKIILSSGKARMQDEYYELWRGIKKRCYTSSNSSYKNYGARGIKMHTEWLSNVDGFDKFRDYVQRLANAKKERFTLDRINNDGDYEPGNLRWATRQTQNLNTRRSTNLDNKMTNIYARQGKYRVMIFHKKKSLTNKTFDSLGEAKKHRELIRKRYAKFTNNNELPDDWEELTPVISGEKQVDNNAVS